MRLAAIGGVEWTLLLIWLLLVGGGIVGWLFFLVAAWRAMKAHESIAANVKDIIDILRSRGAG